MGTIGGKLYGRARLGIAFAITLAAWAASPKLSAQTPDRNPKVAEPAALPAPACAVQGPVDNWDATAQLIAGVSGTSFTASFNDDQKSAWTDYSKTAAADWNRLKRRYVDRIMAWRAKYLQKSPPTDVVFYPFSGPDATNAMAFFPDAREYVLVGLEPVGCVPSKPEDFAPEYWPALRQGWQSAVSMGFFKTEDMQHDLTEGSASGVLPILLFLIARAGNSIVGVQQVGVNASGSIVPLPDAPPSGPAAKNDGPKVETRGVAIQFKDPKRGVRTMTYFACNLRNQRLEKKPGTTKYLNGLPPGGTLVKSASYLMHKKYFSDVRGIILARANVVIEDDSGIPYHYFDPAAWDVHLFGAYDMPIKLFEQGFQDDLKAAYDANKDIQPLDFPFSYKFRTGESNLLLAVKHTGTKNR